MLKSRTVIIRGLAQEGGATAEQLAEIMGTHPGATPNQGDSGGEDDESVSDDQKVEMRELLMTNDELFVAALNKVGIPEVMIEKAKADKKLRAKLIDQLLS